MLYLYIKALHVIAMVAWMAGMLYLPRLFAYHADVPAGSDQARTFEIMEKRLLRYIMNPAMLAVWALGMTLIILNPAWMEGGWLHVKLLCVVLMTALHMVFAGWRKKLAAGQNTRPAKFYKLWNEAPTLLMIVIIIMVIVKPF